MNLPIDKYPTEGSSNENVLFTTLGAFWTRVFQDRAAIRGLTFAQAEEICQSYYDLLAAIDSYSASHIHVFKTVKWFPLVIKESELNGSVLRFGEGVKFGEQVESTNYTFGAPMPQDVNVYSINLPDKLSQISIITNRVIAPDFVLVNNLDVRIKGRQLQFYGNPFNLKNVNVTDLIGVDGNPVYYTHPLTGQQIPDRLLILWAYNAGTSTTSLNYNIGYLFGVHIEPSVNAKNILEAVVKLCTGPSVSRLKNLCGAFLGVKPVLETEEIVVEVRDLGAHRVVVTDKHVYRFDKYYNLRSDVIPGNKFFAGDVLCDAIEYYDAVTYKSWWLNKMAPKIAQSNSGVKSPAITLPPYMFAGNQKYGLTFKNELELVTRDTAGYISFPVEGATEDVRAFNDYINQAANKQSVLDAVGGLTNGSAKLVNPLDFLFTNLFRTNAAMVKINFKDLKQLNMFTQFFPIFKKCLPAHVYCIFFFDIMLENDTYESRPMSQADALGAIDATSYEIGDNTRNYTGFNQNWEVTEASTTTMDLSQQTPDEFAVQMTGEGFGMFAIQNKGLFKAGTEMTLRVTIQVTTSGGTGPVNLVVESDDGTIDYTAVVTNGGGSANLVINTISWTPAVDQKIYMYVYYTGIASNAVVNINFLNFMLTPSSIVDPTIPPVYRHKPLPKQADGVTCNGYGSLIPSNVYVDDRIIVRPIENGITTKDYNFIDLTKDQHPELI